MSGGMEATFTGSTLSGIVILPHSDHDIAFFLPCFDIPVSLDNLG
jgi:hypothetical protein